MGAIGILTGFTKSTDRPSMSVLKMALLAVSLTVAHILMIGCSSNPTMPRMIMYESHVPGVQLQLSNMTWLSRAPD